jgi:hypothetical protein
MHLNSLVLKYLKQMIIVRYAINNLQIHNPRNKFTIRNIEENVEQCRRTLVNKATLKKKLCFQYLKNRNS